MPRWLPSLTYSGGPEIPVNVKGGVSVVMSEEGIWTDLEPTYQTVMLVESDAFLWIETIWTKVSLTRLAPSLLDLEFRGTVEARGWVYLSKEKENAMIIEFALGLLPYKLFKEAEREVVWAACQLVEMVMEEIDVRVELGDRRNVRKPFKTLRGSRMAREQSMMERMFRGWTPRRFGGGVEMVLPTRNEWRGTACDWVGVEVVTAMSFLWVERVWNPVRESEARDEIDEGDVESVGTVYLSKEGWHMFCVCLAAGWDPTWILGETERLTWEMGGEFANEGWDEVRSRVVLGGWEELRLPYQLVQTWVPHFVANWFGGYEHIRAVADSLSEVDLGFTWLADAYYRTSLRLGPFHGDRAMEVVEILEALKDDRFTMEDEVEEAILHREVAVTPSYVGDVFLLFERVWMAMARRRVRTAQRPAHPRPSLEIDNGWEVSLSASYEVRGIDVEWRAVILGQNQAFMLVECLWSGMRFNRGPGGDLYTDLGVTRTLYLPETGWQMLGTELALGHGLLPIFRRAARALNRIGHKGYLSDAKKKLTFNGANITKFLIDYENLAALLRWSEEEKMEHLGQHVSLNLGRDIMAIVAMSASWKEARDVMMRKYLAAEKMATEAELAAVQRKDFATYNDFLREFTLVALRIPGVTNRIKSKYFLRQFTEFDKDKILSAYQQTTKFLNTRDVDFSTITDIAEKMVVTDSLTLLKEGKVIDLTGKTGDKVKRGIESLHDRVHGVDGKIERVKNALMVMQAQVPQSQAVQPPLPPQEAIAPAGIANRGNKRRDPTNEQSKYCTLIGHFVRTCPRLNHDIMLKRCSRTLRGESLGPRGEKINWNSPGGMRQTVIAFNNLDAAVEEAEPVAELTWGQAQGRGPQANFIMESDGRDKVNVTTRQQTAAKRSCRMRSWRMRRKDRVCHQE
ncbi:hypothetical protein CBR_g48248 [Chara braunii]|uniref:Retrotransposon gag domain-containing protein n=1 Tax=Chara braunii TaxID=69332 RepID=A0A388M2A7_CHABU|nr:hypothetical protein CBR_g48248 [Chara braunii]|eukprot:GBG88718.1 hypothetical protein CBR_g48248 [Chara braunii]